MCPEHDTSAGSGGVVRFLSVFSFFLILLRALFWAHGDRGQQAKRKGKRDHDEARSQRERPTLPPFSGDERVGDERKVTKTLTRRQTEPHRPLNDDGGLEERIVRRRPEMVESFTLNWLRCGLRFPPSFSFAVSVSMSVCVSVPVKPTGTQSSLGLFFK